MYSQLIRRRRLVCLPCLLACAISGCAALATLPPPPGAAGAAGAAAAGAAGAAPPPPTTAQAGATTVVAVAPPAQPCCKMTLPEWLGLTNCCAKISRLLSVIPGIVGMFAPGLGNALAQAATQPPLLPINSPANLQSSNPAVQTAAQVMNDENQAPQKIAAIKYLATIGCGGCYPEVEASLLASLDDCTESVRFAAAKAFYDTTGRPCAHCNSKACCSARVRQKLSAIAYDMKDETCYVESSPRVRRMARLALMNCGSDCFGEAELTPLEGPAMAPTPAAPGAAAPGAAPPAGAAPTPIPPAPQAAARSVYQPAVASSAPSQEPVRQWSARGNGQPAPGSDQQTSDQQTTVTRSSVTYPTGGQSQPVVRTAESSGAWKSTGVVTVGHEQSLENQQPVERDQTTGLEQAGAHEQTGRRKSAVQTTTSGERTIFVQRPPAGWLSLKAGSEKSAKDLPEWAQED